MPGSVFTGRALPNSPNFRQWNPMTPLLPPTESPAGTGARTPAPDEIVSRTRDGGSAHSTDGLSLRNRALTGAIWVLVGHLVSQVLRFGSSLILTRLLFPEAFGLMTLITTFLVGLHMFSDIGIGPSIVQNKRGEEPSFLNTAWTIQIVRGVVLWACSCFLAWPLAALYGLPEVAWILPVAALTAVAQGFNSTALFTSNRQLSFGRVTAIELGTQGAATLLMVSLAWIYHSVWVLVAGNLFAAVAKAILSHAVLRGARHRLHWDREAAVSLVRFGRWIFFGTLLTYFCLSADRLVLGYFMTSTEFGVYSLAFILSQVVFSMVQHLSDKVVFPVYARLGNCGPEELRAKVYRLRRTVLVGALPPLCVLAVGGPGIINLLYDTRYQNAGWMLRILAIGSIIPISTATLSPLILARGDSFRHLIVLASRLALTVGAMITGGLIAGSAGLIIGYAFSPVLLYPVLVVAAFRPYGVWMPVLDLCAVIVPVSFIALGLWIFN